MKQAQMIKALNKRFPGLVATNASDFYGHSTDGIWLRGTECTDIDGLPVYSSYSMYETMGVNPTLNAFLQDKGWYAEPYDSGTLMAYPD